ncbi:MAG: Stk1 family PASTA domain-containing Ser/Thr kinase [Alicyclobacillus herbarius]|uniref:Stk1 family PASTA domain-containing Ser/Thr kinase n=1 Tax=Alicyclobacillus herbarius TaxID=122960 RepID=UPI002357BD3A|nr:Stk1 family PASTA domain-containing Ser/Thr kinase [Alicyclobacillus herbarius]MCL6632117.1 Stk1 family PASTA domain-containing Ser/Thr kinase [Alicyclobacillus herbarius]
MSRRLGDRYELREQVGGGGMAVVYRALDTLLGRTVAVKMLRPQYVEDEEFISRFRQEAQSAARLSHPNIVNIYDVGMTDGEYYIVMEFVDGPTLKDLIREKGALSPEQTVAITCQICDALQHAHSHHIVHRDIKPHNILLTKSGQVKVTDFGIARALTGNTVTIDHSGSVLGSVHYLSPEQARGGAADIKSDIYSLGVVMYEMLTGRLPFQGDSAVSVALKHLRDQFVEPRQIRPEIPQSLENIVLRCLVKQADERYPDMKALRNDLDEALANPDVPKFEPPHDVSEATIAIPAITEDVAPFKAAEVKERPAVSRQAAIPDERRSGRRWIRTSLWLTLSAVMVAAGAVAAYFIVMRLLEVPNVKLPNVVGKPESKAIQILEQAGFQRGQIQEQRQISSKQPKGIVIRQDPSGLTEVKQDRPVTLYVSAGAPKVSMPDLTGVTVDQAMQQLVNLGFAKNHLQTKQVDSDEYPAGEVVATHPSANQMVSTDSQVVLTVSRGQAETTVPSVIGKSLDEASKMLVDAKLVVGQIIPQAQPGVANGTVVNTAPNRPGDTVKPGTAIDLYIADNGPDTGTDNSTDNATAPTNGSSTDNSSDGGNASMPTNTQEHDVTVQVDGAKSGTHVVIVKSDATGNNQQVVDETIEGHKEYPVVLYLAPHHDGEIDVYVDGKLVKRQKVKYSS